MTNRFAGTTPDPVARGSDLSIKFTDASKAGQTVPINVVDPENGTSDTVQVPLDANGVGSVNWQVPATWGGFVLLEGPDSADETIRVVDPKKTSRKKKTPRAPAKKPPARSAAKGRKR